MHNGKARIRRQRTKRRNPQLFIDRHVLHTIVIMVWGGITSTCRDPLVFVRGNMFAHRYVQEIVEPYILP